MIRRGSIHMIRRAYLLMLPTGVVVMLMPAIPANPMPAAPAPSALLQDVQLRVNVQVERKHPVVLTLVMVA